MKYSSLDISEYIVSFCNKLNKKCTYTKLQFILFYIQGYSLSITGETVFNEDFITTFDGPILLSIYKKYYKNSNSPIENQFFSFIDDKQIEALIKLAVMVTIDRTDEEIKIRGRRELSQLLNQKVIMENFKILPEEIETYFRTKI